MKKLTAATYRNQAIQRTHIYSIMKNVQGGGGARDQRGKINEKNRSVATLITLIADFADKVEKYGSYTY